MANRRRGQSTLIIGTVGLLAWMTLAGPVEAQPREGKPDRAERREAREQRQENADAKARYKQIMDDPARSVGFLEKTIQHGTAERVYQLWVPLDYDAEKTYPVLLYLHDKNGRGIYGKKVLRSALPRYIEQHHGAFPWIVVIPQALPQEMWSTSQRQLAVKVLDRTGRDYPVDEQRIYLVGEGEGGDGAIALAAEQPRRFAALLAISASEAELADRIAHLPVWLFHARGGGGSTWRAQNTFAALTEAGLVEARYTELDGGDEAAEAMFGSRTLEWLADHQLDMLGKQPPKAPVVDAPRWRDRPLSTWFRLDRRGNPEFPQTDLPTSMSRVKTELRGGRYASAMSQLETLIELGRIKAEQIEQARQLHAALVDYRETLEQATEAYINKRNYTPAFTTLQALAQQFRSQPQADAATAKLTELKQDPAVRDELTAGQLYNRARTYERMRKYRDAAAIYNLLINKYPDTWGGQRAKYHFDALKASGKI